MLIQSHLKVNIPSGISYLIVAVLLLGYYLFLRIKWIGILSVLLVYVSTIDLAPNIPVIGVYLSKSIAFLLPGLFLLFVYYKYKKGRFLVFALLLLWIGIAKVISTFSLFEPINYPILIFCLGNAFISIYFLGKKMHNTLVPGIVLFGFGLFESINYYLEINFEQFNTPTVVFSALLILFGITLFFENEESTKKLKELDERKNVKKEQKQLKKQEKIEEKESKKTQKEEEKRKKQEEKAKIVQEKQRLKEEKARIKEEEIKIKKEKKLKKQKASNDEEGYEDKKTVEKNEK